MQNCNLLPDINSWTQISANWFTVRISWYPKFCVVKTY